MSQPLNPATPTPEIISSTQLQRHIGDTLRRVFKEFGDNLERYLNRAALANTMRHPELGY